ncbi:putative DSB repair complex subunit Ku70 [Taphrina deformans PYCC 5710]|uniref:ATP-dependent DNA helicase II subunit 1 n=1 Tax=Taphrina deformans (strain PYCC 5710 / ATCC 11124 / CBS 356.35 / IMI 108563 / JCM 9778 / NBRC 8474) TaxID=1097556 RepID=R4X704_TAPDE|nr:putative DSB repair complex subunit Ku70 [Taphrina deformans PYCC 5710]|eukprot:CCG80791.1 putative DSB repair complex subunit Ku70 [Taphrina deformans PYCC 5710]
MEEDLKDEADQQYMDQLYSAQKEATLFMIDVSQSMLADRGKKGDSTVQHALECAYRFLTYKIIANPNDMVGILLYGTENTSCPESYGYTSCANVYALVDLDCPDAPSMRQLKEVLDNKTKFEEICTPTSRPPTLTNVLFLANGMFSQKAPNFNFKRIILVTDEDDPHKKDKVTRQAAITRARDLNDLGIRIEPIFVSTETEPFNSRKFYDDIIFKDDDDHVDELDLVEEGELRFQQMMERIKAKASPKRAVFSIPLELGPGLQIGVKGYITYKEQKISKSAYVYNLGNRPQFAKTETTNVCVDTSKPLEKEEIKKGFRFGEDRISFAEDELKALKYVGDPVLRIVGIKSFDKLKFWHNIRPAYFIYPHEATVVGSTRVFASLHQSLLKKDKWALAWFIPRKNAMPTMVAMVASKEAVSAETHVQISPPGIFLITLPFMDDIRNNPQIVITRSPDELTDKMSDVVRHLKLADYNPSKYQNPALQWHWRTLQALALEEDMPEPSMDGTLPKYKGIEKRAGQLIRAWNECFASVADNLKPVSMPQKRMGESEAATQASKKIKTEDAQTTVEDLKRAIADNHIEKLTVPVLKQVIKDFPQAFNGRPVSQKKSDLVFFIKDSLS